MSKHTPGPWKAICDNPRQVNRMAMVATYGGGGVCIDCTKSGDSYEMDCANARLIAAAPELLEALRAIVATTIEMGGTTLKAEQHNARLFAAISAIAKATGEQP